MKTRITKLMVAPEGADLYDDRSTHVSIDDVGVPRCDSAGTEYSAWGRVIQYAKAAAKAEARNE